MVNRKPKNVVQKFRGFWSGLNKNEKGNLYDLLATIRGPDINNKSQYQNSNKIKRLGTGRIRYMLMGNSADGIRTDNKLKRSDLIVLTQLIDKTRSKNNFSHYTIHLRNAIDVLEEIGIVEFKDWDQHT